MADNEADKTAPETPEEEVHAAKVGAKDTGHKVSTALGERVDGRLADIADGD